MAWRNVPGLRKPGGQDIGRPLWAAAIALFAAALSRIALRHILLPRAMSAAISASAYPAGGNPVLFPGLTSVSATDYAWSLGVGTIAFTCIWLFGRTGEARRVAGRGPSSLLAAAGWGVATGVAGAAVVAALAPPAGMTGAVLARWWSLMRHGSPGATGALLLLVAGVPLAAEAAFRGTLLPAALTVAEFAPAAAATSVLFGAVWPTAGGWAAGCALGIIAALCYRRTGRMLAPILTDIVASAGFLAAAVLLATHLASH